MLQKWNNMGYSKLKTWTIGITHNKTAHVVPELQLVSDEAAFTSLVEALRLVQCVFLKKQDIRG